MSARISVASRVGPIGGVVDDGCSSGTGGTGRDSSGAFEVRRGAWCQTSREWATRRHRRPRAQGAVILALPHLGGGSGRRTGWPRRATTCSRSSSTCNRRGALEWSSPRREAMGGSGGCQRSRWSRIVLRALRETASWCRVRTVDLTGLTASRSTLRRADANSRGDGELALRQDARVRSRFLYFGPGRSIQGVVARAHVRDLAAQGRGETLRVTSPKSRQSLAQRVRDPIRAAPEQWHLLQPKAERPAE